MEDFYKSEYRAEFADSATDLSMVKGLKPVKSILMTLV